MHNQFEGKERVLRPSEKVFSVIMQRLTKWVFNRYDCTVDHVFFIEGRAEHETLKSLFHKNAFVRINGALNFPIHFAGDVIGAVRAVESGRELTLKQQKELNQLFSLMIEPTLKDLEQLEQIESLEEHMSLVHQSPSENLIRFKKRKSDEELFAHARMGQPGQTRLLLPCLIESKNLDDSKKLAQEIHYQSGRYAFFAITDLDEDTLDNPENLDSIGAATIFVPCLEALSSREIQFLLTFISGSKNSKVAPQIIATTLNIQSLKDGADDNLIRLIESLSVALIKMDRPFSDYKKIGLMNLMFSALQPPETSH